MDAMGIRRPTDIQYKSIPHILKGEDILAVAQTGTGKTAAFAIPLIDMLHRKKQKARRRDGVKCLILVPTHELAMQIADVFVNLGKHTSVRTIAIIGGVDQDAQIKSLGNWVDIVVATPGRVFDLTHQGHLRLKRIEILVLDEADHMLDLGFIDDILDLKKMLPNRRQTLFFSATINKNIKQLAYKIINQKAIRIQVSPKNPVAKNVEHAVAFIEMDDKRFFLERFVKERPDQKILVFVRTRVRAERVVKAMQRVDVQAEAIHGEMNQIERTAVLNRFKSGQNSLLIATDVSARGIDIPDVEFVINYDMPEQPQNYVHRVGRTGRGKNKGHAISFCSKGERPLLDDIESYTGQRIEHIEVTSSDSETTRFLSDEGDANWQDLINDHEELKKKKSGRK